MVMMAPEGLQAVANASNPMLASNLLSNPAAASAAASAARNMPAEETRGGAAAQPAASTQVDISDNGRALLQAEQTNAIGVMPDMAAAANAPQVTQNAPVAPTGATPDARNDTMLTAAQPTGSVMGGTVTDGVPVNSASPIAPVAPVVSNAPSVTPTPEGAAAATTPANPGTPRAEAGRQQAEATAMQAQAQQNNNRAEQQDVSPALAQSGIAAYQGVFSN
ncbi:MAG: hypothetical protein FWH15_07255 [Betaproteobacteria bacterium]|nr:hypothetical protein [Betaproteobacteria bacterium]